MLSLKAGADISKLSGKLWYAASVLDDVVAEVMGTEQEIIITAGRNGKHAVGSKHYDTPGRALDFRTHNLTQADKIAKALQSKLGGAYLVLHEDAGTSNEHIHVQFGLKGK